MILKQAIGFVLILKIVQNVNLLSRRTEDVIICLVVNVNSNFVGFVVEIGKVILHAINTNKLVKTRKLHAPHWNGTSIISIDIMYMNNKRNWNKMFEQRRSQRCWNCRKKNLHDGLMCSSWK